MGSITPGQAYSVGYLADRWMKLYHQLGYSDAKRALDDLILPTLVDATSAAAAEREAALTDEAERDIVAEAELALIIKHGPAIIPFLTGEQPSATDDQAPPSSPGAPEPADPAAPDSVFAGAPAADDSHDQDQVRQ